MLFAETDFWTAFFANLPAAIMALASLIGVVLGHFKIKSVKDGQEEMKKEQAIIKADVHTIEKATNSMKDALVQAAGDRGFLEGKQEERRNPETPGTPASSGPPSLVAPVGPTTIRQDIAGIPEKTAKAVVNEIEKREDESPPQK